VVSEIDIERLQAERRTVNSFSSSDIRVSCIETALPVASIDNLTRKIDRHPFVPPEHLREERCDEILSIQIGGLSKRLLHTGIKKSILGISGGLDSTLALLVCVKAYDKLHIKRENIIGLTMPGFGTTGRTYDNAMKIMRASGVTVREINITEACMLHFRDIGHDPELHDITYENVQARERTQILMDVANQTGGLVIGTGDLSELALGWCTYNGDHMSMYAVNSSIPKTLVRTLVRFIADGLPEVKTVLYDILDTPVSPELLPQSKDKPAQETENILGPYELHDFFLYYFIRFGFSPAKIFFLAEQAFGEQYSAGAILTRMETFFKRFFSQQFKRSCMPDGPKVGSVSLSPRGDWRMPSDASAALWIDEIENMRYAMSDVCSGDSCGRPHHLG
jgi:NAD+ synthase (glutamine-hydrolysing)